MNVSIHVLLFCALLAYNW